MSKANHQPDVNRRQTRATNANAHPGRVVLEVLAGRRKKEDIENDKKAQNERRDTRERKTVERQVAIKDIADFENQMALDDQVQETVFPRHQDEGRQSGSSLLKMYPSTFSECSNQATWQEQET